MPDIIEVMEAGEVRRLGLLEQPEDSLRFAWPAVGDDATPPIIPRSEWRTVSLKTFVKKVDDQDGVGMCASSGTQNTLEIAREMEGLEYVPLSGGDLYRRVCGGRDQGSLPEENLAELINNGIAPVSVCPYLQWKKEMPGAEEAAKKFRGLEAWRCGSVDAVASAIQHGFPVLIGYWHASKDPVKSDGRMDAPSGKEGGHAVCVVGLEMIGDTPWFWFENSWTPSFGIAGFAKLPESRLAKGIKSFQAWALRATIQESGSLPPLRA